jgi:deoxyadenosine/deoxycytidine kinase
MMSSRIVYVEGNISSGKTTLVKGLRGQYIVFEEPLDKWQTEYKLGDANILELFYNNMREFSFKFEMMSLVTRYRQLIDALQHTDNIIIIERSYMCCRRVFAQNLYDQGLIDELEWKIYTEAHAMYSEIIQMILKPYNPIYLYLRTLPGECYARKVGRNRAEEESATPKYLVQIHDYHEKWFVDTPCITIDGNQSADKILSDAIGIIRAL